MKIAIAAPTYLPSRRANTIQVMKMAQAFVEAGHQVKLAVPSYGTKKITYRWEELANHYGLHYEFEIHWLSIHARWRGYDFAFKSIQWLRSWKAEFLYTRHPQTAAFGSIIGIPTILEVHDNPNGFFPHLLFNLFIWGNGAKRLVIITHALAEDLAKKIPTLSVLMPKRPEYVVIGNRFSQTSSFITILPDGVDMIRYQNLPSTEGARDVLSFSHNSIDVQKFTVGYTGHFYEGRGTNLLLEMAAALPDVQFLLVGGEAAGIISLQKKVKELNLQNVIICGFVPNAELALYQAACDVLLMPYEEKVAASSGGDISKYLSPMKAFEYLASGRAVIASQLPVFKEIFNNQNALFVDHNDLQAWILAIQSLKQDKAYRLALGEQAKKDAQQYDWNSRAVKILEGLT